MAHYQQLKFVETVRQFFPDKFSNQKVLEVGSWNVSGSVRQFFDGCDYTGVDVSPGPGVDVICFGQDLDYPSGIFDTVISCECFEHNPEWVATFKNMHRMLKDDGIFVLTCATYGRREHGTPRRSMDSSLTSDAEGGEYYLNLSMEDLKVFLPIDKLFVEHQFFYNHFSKDFYFVGIKAKSNLGGFSQAEEFLVAVNSIKRDRPVSYIEDLLKRFKFNLIFLLTKIIGDKAYQDFRYAISSKSK